ncbi:CDGSH iron-sulfur domain-containing protein [Leucobacter luti]|uniref:CDGSH iron-sulfur domain-containing protein n=1 Tax=Leucobacter luti TaxID=340320 RepID=UPI003D0284D5
MTEDRPSITPCPDGPLLVRGRIEILTPEGKPVPRRRRTVALCRCGLSTIKPYCDGTHKAAGFRTDDEEPDEDPPSEEAAGP